MNSWLPWVGGGIAALIVAAALVEAYVKRNRKRSLADMRPDPDDISKVAGIERHGMDPVTLAQAEHRRLEEEGWAKRPEQTEPQTPAKGDKETRHD